MKTTVEISDGLIRRLKARAVEEGRPLRTLIEAAVARFLDPPVKPPRRAFKLRNAAVRGKGLARGLEHADWAGIRARAYEGRGG